MGILDEAIREHLELKRQHGADDSELKQLEDDAFGPPQRPGGEPSPDPAAEAPTEFMSQPGLDDAGEEGPSDEYELEAPPAEAAPPPSGRREPAVEASFMDLQEAPDLQQPERGEDEGAERAEDEEAAAEDDERPPGTPNVEDQPAAEHEAVREIPSGPNTEERHAIADQPTEMFDVQKEFEADGDAGTADLPAPADEELVAEEIAEPRLAPAPDPTGEDEDDFFDHQRLSDELDQALEAPVEVTDDSEEDEEDSAEHEAVERTEIDDAADRTEIDDAADRTELHEVVDRTEIHEVVEKPADEDHDALEETPDFLEESPDDDQLWFEQKPPKDFDFDD